MPTDRQLRVLKKGIRTADLLRRVWGEGVENLRFVGSPHEGEVVDDAEMILHELAHQTLMPVGAVFSPGAMNHAFKWVGGYIDRLPLYRQDLHEIKAIAIELLVGNRLGIGLRREYVLRAGRRSTAFFRRKPLKIMDNLVRRAQRLPHVQHRADTIMEFIAQQRKELRCQPSKQNESSP